MPVRLIEPASWLPEPGADALPFKAVRHAVIYAMSRPTTARHNRHQVRFDLWMGCDRGDGPPSVAK
jgi:hypothetical protein